MKSRIIFFIFLFFIVLLFFTIRLKNNSIFTLSPQDINTLLQENTEECLHLNDCKLFDGDILIRKYSTNTTKLFENLFHPYFTHSAFYYGNGMVIEAIGDNPDDSKEIQARNINETDWKSEDMESWVIIRPKISSDKIEAIKNRLLIIAGDSGYTFGIKAQGNKKYSCASLIFDQFAKEGIVNMTDSYPIDLVTPDFIFNYATENKDTFSIIGFRKANN